MKLYLKLLGVVIISVVVFGLIDELILGTNSSRSIFISFAPPIVITYFMYKKFNEDSSE